MPHISVRAVQAAPITGVKHERDPGMYGVGPAGMQHAPGPSYGVAQSDMHPEKKPKVITQARCSTDCFLCANHLTLGLRHLA